MGDKTNLSCLPQASWLRDDTRRPSLAVLRSKAGTLVAEAGGVTFIHRLRVILSGGRSP